jgi:glutamate racemase
MGLIGLVHTTRLVIEPVHDAIAGSIDGIDLNHVLDEGILRRLAALGRITPEITDWLTRMVAATEEAGAELAIVSCSSLSPCVSEVGKRVGIPVIKVDEPMVEYAVQNGDSIGLVMTNPTTESPSKKLFEEVADRLGRTVTLVPKLCPGAFARLSNGDLSGHDTEVAETVELLLEQVDLVMLAQISIARVRTRLDRRSRTKVLSSLDFIAEKTREMTGTRR